MYLLGMLPSDLVQPVSHAHQGPNASGHVHSGCTPPPTHTRPVSLRRFSSSQRKAGAHLQQGPPLLACSPLGRPCGHQGRMYWPLYPDPLLTGSLGFPGLCLLEGLCVLLHILSLLK